MKVPTDDTKKFTFNAFAYILKTIKLKLPEKTKYVCFRFPHNSFTAGVKNQSVTSFKDTSTVIDRQNGQIMHIIKPRISEKKTELTVRLKGWILANAIHPRAGKTEFVSSVQVLLQ